MNHIVKEVDHITADPTVITRDDYVEPFIGPVLFESLLPVIQPIPAKSETPLTGVVLGPTESDKTGANSDASNASNELLSDPRSQGLSSDETNKVNDVKRDKVNVGEHLRLTPPVGDESAGTLFCNLDFVLLDFCYCGRRCWCPRFHCSHICQLSCAQ
jgi:hypothetical protein